MRLCAAPNIFEVASKTEELIKGMEKLQVNVSMIDQLVKGSIEIHCHFGPQPAGERRFDPIETAQIAEQAEMRAVCIKCNYFPTGALAYLAQKHVEDVRVFGYVSLNNYIGGLNPEAVEAAIRIGTGKPGEYTKIVTLPTASVNVPEDKAYYNWAKNVEVFRNGKIAAEAKEIFNIIKEHNLVLATGHSDPETTISIIEEARAAGLQKIIATHVEYKSIDATIEQQKRMADLGAFIEHLWVMCTPYYKFRYNHFVAPEQIAEAIKEVGASKCIMGTDSGGDPGMNPPLPEGMRMFIGAMLACGITPEEIEVMVKKNPAYLLQI